MFFMNGYIEFVAKISYSPSKKDLKWICIWLESSFILILAK